MATHSNILAWEILWTEEPGGYSPWVHKESDALSRVRLFATPWTVACQTPPSMGFSRQEYWSGLPFPSGVLPDPGIKPTSAAWQVDSCPLSPLGSPVV